MLNSSLSFDYVYYAYSKYQGKGKKENSDVESAFYRSCCHICSISLSKL